MLEQHVMLFHGLSYLTLLSDYEVLRHNMYGTCSRFFPNRQYAYYDIDYNT